MLQINYDPVKYATPSGSQLTCKGWIQEAALRMLLNKFSQEEARHYSKFIMYGGSPEVSEHFESLNCIIATLKVLENDETFVIHNGKPTGIIKTHKDAPRLLISNSEPVLNAANWDHFDELKKKGLMLYSQMTREAPMYIISQAIVQRTYETYAAIATQYFKGTLKGTLNVTAGLGSMGGAQPFSITMNEGVALIAEAQEELIDKRIASGHLDVKITDIDKAIDQALKAKTSGKAISIAVLCNAVHLLERIVARNLIPDTLTDQTSAHDPLNGYWPHEMSYDFAKVLRVQNPKQYTLYAESSIYRHAELMLELQRKGSITFDFGNNIRSRVNERGWKNAFSYFVPSKASSLPGESKGAFRWLALSGDSSDITAADELIINMFPENKSLLRWMKIAKEKIAFQRLPSRLCWLAQHEREEAGVAFNQLVGTGKVKAPIIVGFDHLDTGSATCCTSHVSDWPVLSTLANIAGGAGWVSLYCGSANTAYNTLASMVMVADGTDDAAMRLRRVLQNNPCKGIIRPVDAGYNIPQRTPKENKLDLNFIIDGVVSAVDV